LKQLPSFCYYELPAAGRHGGLHHCRRIGQHDQRHHRRIHAPIKLQLQYKVGCGRHRVRIIGGRVGHQRQDALEAVEGQVGQIRRVQRRKRPGEAGAAAYGQTVQFELLEREEGRRIGDEQWGANRGRRSVRIGARARDPR